MIPRANLSFLPFPFSPISCGFLTPMGQRFHGSVRDTRTRRSSDPSGNNSPVSLTDETTGERARIFAWREEIRATKRAQTRFAAVYTTWIYVIELEPLARRSSFGFIHPAFVCNRRKLERWSRRDQGSRNGQRSDPLSLERGRGRGLFREIIFERLRMIL